MSNFQSILNPKKPEHKETIIIGGKMYAGKSTFGELIKARMPVTYEVSPLAYKIKELVNTYFGLTWEESLELKSELRPDYQHVGTEVMRNGYKDDFWIITALRHPSPYLIFDDVRYVNEIETIKEYSTHSLAVYIDADEETRRKRCDAKFGPGTFDKQQHGHSSELGFTGNESCWDYVIDNSEQNEDQLAAIVGRIVIEYCNNAAPS